VCIEAGLYGLPVLASRIEGITDAVIESRTGRLIAPQQSKEWRKAIEQSSFDRHAVVREVKETYSREYILPAYLSVLDYNS
jgi:hypothetical protein